MHLVPNDPAVNISVEPSTENPVPPDEDAVELDAMIRAIAAVKDPGTLFEHAVPATPEINNE